MFAIFAATVPPFSSRKRGLTPAANTHAGAARLYPNACRITPSKISSGESKTSYFVLVAVPSITVVQLAPAFDISYLNVYEAGESTFMV